MHRLPRGLAWLLLLLATVLLTLRWLNTGARWADALASGASYAAVVCVLAAALFLTAARWPRGRSASTALGLSLCLAGVVLVVVVDAGLFLGGGPRLQPGAPALTLMTLNTKIGHADAHQIIRRVRDDRVGVLVLEEVTPALAAGLDRAGLPSLLPQHAGRPAPGGHGTMVFSRWRLSRARPVHVTNGGVEVRLSGPVPTRLVGLHLGQPLAQHTGWARDLTTLANIISSPGEVVVAGDLNSTLDNPALRKALPSGVRDAAEEANAGWQPTWPAQGVDGLPIPPLLAIDHVLIGGPLRAIDLHRIAISGTDHRGLLVRLSP